MGGEALSLMWHAWVAYVGCYECEINLDTFYYNYYKWDNLTVNYYQPC